MKKFIFILGILLPMLMVAQDQVFKGSLTLQNHLYLQTDGLHTTPIGQYGKRFVFGSAGHDNGDIIWMSRFNRAVNQSDLRIAIGDDGGGDDRFVVGNIKYNANGNWKDWFVVTNQARVGIGVSHPTCALDVNGTIRAKEVKIEATGWADFVFAPGYNLLSLSEVKKHIEDKQHLPNIPSASEVKENGVDLGEMQVKLLQKIEELTLYVIIQNERIDNQQRELEILKMK